MSPVRLFGLLIALAVAAPGNPALAQDGLRHTPVTATFATVTHDWPQNNGGLVIRWQAEHHGGRLWICGAVEHTRARARRANRTLLRKGWIRRGDRNGALVLRDLSFFTDTNGSGFAATPATCRPASRSGPADGLVLGHDPFTGFDQHMDSF